MVLSNTEKSRKFSRKWGTISEKFFIENQLMIKNTNENKLKFLRNYKKGMKRRKDWTSINRATIEGFIFELIYKYEDHADG